MRPMNGEKTDARELIDRIMADERFRASSHFSERVYRDEPILTTGGRMASYLPQRYREMRAISRWEPGVGNGRGRWLSEAELFYRQGMFMADYEDDCPYRGNFKSYFPTYSAMSDRQLRGYFTWRAAVRRGDVEETSLSFAYVYLYELINGIGVSNPDEGFSLMRAFWRSYRAFAPEIDRFASVWLQDYAVYHGLSPALLDPCKTLSFDRSLIALRRADELAREAGSPRRKRGASALPLPCRESLERELFEAIDELSTYRLSGSRLYKEHAEALRHVACAVFVRTSEYYRKHHKHPLIESWFGKEVSLPYAMFGSAVFFESNRHEDATYELDEIHRYRCRSGSWTCERVHGSRSRSPKLGACMHAVDRRLRERLGLDHPLKEGKPVPKYLERFIEEEIEAWTSWKAAHTPRPIRIDLAQLDGIRSAAVLTRESLLIDEEREETGTTVPTPPGAGESSGNPCGGFPLEPRVLPEEAPRPQAPASLAPPGTPRAPSATAAPIGAPLAPGQLTYLKALLDGDPTAAHEALGLLGTSEDLAVDAINETLFDLVGDTVIEYGQDGPAIIEDYRDDVEGLLHHE